MVKINQLSSPLFGGSSSGGKVKQITLLSITTAPSGTFAKGSQYYNSSTKKIYIATVANSWNDAKVEDPQFGVIYLFDNQGTTEYYQWDGDNLVETDLEKYQLVANMSQNFEDDNELKYPSNKALNDGLDSVKSVFVKDMVSYLPLSGFNEGDKYIANNTLYKAVKGYIIKSGINYAGTFIDAIDGRADFKRASGYQYISKTYGPSFSFSDGDEINCHFLLKSLLSCNLFWFGGNPTIQINLSSTSLSIREAYSGNSVSLNYSFQTDVHYYLTIKKIDDNTIKIYLSNVGFKIDSLVEQEFSFSHLASNKTYSGSIYIGAVSNQTWQCIDGIIYLKDFNIADWVNFDTFAEKTDSSIGFTQEDFEENKIYCIANTAYRYDGSNKRLNILGWRIVTLNALEAPTSYPVAKDYKYYPGTGTTIYIQNGAGNSQSFTSESLQYNTFYVCNNVYYVYDGTGLVKFRLSDFVTKVELEEKQDIMTVDEEVKNDVNLVTNRAVYKKIIEEGITPVESISSLPSPLVLGKKYFNLSDHKLYEAIYGSKFNSQSNLQGSLTLVGVDGSLVGDRANYKGLTKTGSSFALGEIYKVHFKTSSDVTTSQAIMQLRCVYSSGYYSNSISFSLFVQNGKLYIGCYDYANGSVTFTSYNTEFIIETDKDYYVTWEIVNLTKVQATININCSAIGFDLDTKSKEVIITNSRGELDQFIKSNPPSIAIEYLRYNSYISYNPYYVTTYSNCTIYLKDSYCSDDFLEIDDSEVIADLGFEINDGKLFLFNDSIYEYKNGNIRNIISSGGGTTTWFSSCSISNSSSTTATNIAVDSSKFIQQQSTDGNYTFSFDGSDWSLNGNVVDLNDFGISFEGTPTSGDTIKIVLASIAGNSLSTGISSISSVLKNGVELRPLVDYRINNGTITFTQALVITDEIGVK